jgi:hypothetical protein
MECLCDVDYIDCDIPEEVSHETRIAGKRIRCCECDGWILKGEEHEFTEGQWEGDYYTFRTCASCVLIRDSLFPDRQFTYTGLRKTIWDCLGLDYVTNETIDDEKDSDNE